MTYASSFSTADLANIFTDFLAGVFSVLAQNSTMIAWGLILALGAWIFRTIFAGTGRSISIITGYRDASEKKSILDKIKSKE